MKSVFFFVIAVVGATLSAQASSLCATPSELKLLKAAMLEQALTAAAQSCHQNAEFGRFVAAYHSGMVASDRALQAFFARRKTGETYDAYKTRIAEDLAARSLHDAVFCAEAGRVFDIALKHKRAVPPKLIATGYEHCGTPAVRLPAAQPVLARSEPALRPVKPSPLRPPLPALSPVARKALALAAQKEPPHATLPQPALPPVRLATQTVAQPKLVAAKPTPLAVVPVQQPPLQVKRVAVEARSTSVDDEMAPSDPVPNAYKPGAYWVHHDRGEMETPPRERAPLVQGPDGRWYVIIGHHAHWTND